MLIYRIGRLNIDNHLFLAWHISCERLNYRLLTLQRWKSHMKHIRTANRQKDFIVVAMTRSAEVAIMVLQPGGCSDEEVSNEHPRSEQWLFVVSGSGTVIIQSKQRKRNIKLVPGSLLVIEKHELHQIRNTGRQMLHTINFYVPPAYSKDGELRPSVRK